MQLGFLLAQGGDYEASLNWLGTSLIVSSVILVAGGLICTLILVTRRDK